MESGIEFNESSVNKETVSNTSKNYLLEISKWSGFFAILGFIFTGLIAVMAIFAGTIFGTLADMNPAGMETGFNHFSGFVGVGFTVLYLLLALLYFFPSLYLYRSSKALKIGIRSNDNDQMEEGFKNLKSAFKFWGILTIVIISIYLLFFLSAGLIGAMF